MSKKILANDGIDETGKALLEKAGFFVHTDKISQENLARFINEHDFVAVTVRSATQVRKNIIDSCPRLKLIGRCGVGMDNIDVEYAKSKGIHVVNTPGASSDSVAELVFAHLFGMVRFLYDSNRQMPVNGSTQFDLLKKKYAKGIELKGKTLGIIGIGRIGQAVARIGIGIGMKVIAHDPYVKEVQINMEVAGNKFSFSVATIHLDELLSQSDFISVHVPGGKLITKNEFQKMKKGVCIVNASRGGVVDETDLLEALNSGKVAHAALDVFENEPTPQREILTHPRISLTPHIGAATIEAQERIGTELAEKIIELLK